VLLVESVTPLQAYAGETVRLSGSNLGPDVDSAQAFFAGVPARVLALAEDGSWMDLAVPTDAGTGPVSVLAWGQQAASEQDFLYLGPGHLEHLQLAGEFPLWRDVRAVACVGSGLWVADTRYRVAADNQGRVLPLQTADGPLAPGPAEGLWALDDGGRRLVLADAASAVARVTLDLPSAAAPELVLAEPDGWLGLYPDRFGGEDNTARVWLVDPTAAQVHSLDLGDAAAPEAHTVGLVATDRERFVALVTERTEAGARLVLFEVLGGPDGQEPHASRLGGLELTDPAQQGVLALHRASNTVALLAGAGQVGLGRLGEAGLGSPAGDPALRWLDLAAGQRPSWLRFGPAGRLLYTLDTAGLLHVHDTTSGELLNGAALGAGVAGFGSCPGGAQVLVPLGPLGEVARFAGASGALVDRQQPWVAPRSLTVGWRYGMLSLLAGGRLVRLEMQALALDVEVPVRWSDRQIVALQAAPDELLVLRRGSPESFSELWAPPGGETTLRMAGEVEEALSPAGSLVVAQGLQQTGDGSLEATLGLWDASSGEKVDGLPLPDRRVSALAGLPGDHVALVTRQAEAAPGQASGPCRLQVLHTSSSGFASPAVAVDAEVPCDPVSLLADRRAGVLYILVATPSGELSLVRVAPLRSAALDTHSLPMVGGEHVQAALAPDGRHLYVAPNAGLGGVVAFALDPEGQHAPEIARLLPLEYGVGVHHLVATPGGDRVLALSTDQRLLLFE